MPLPSSLLWRNDVRPAASVFADIALKKAELLNHIAELAGMGISAITGQLEEIAIPLLKNAVGFGIKGAIKTEKIQK